MAVSIAARFDYKSFARRRGCATNSKLGQIMKPRLSVRSFAIAAFLGLASNAMATTINFDDVVGGVITAPTDVSTRYAGVTFVDADGPSGAITASSVGLSGYSAPNVFFANQNQGSDAGDLTLDFAFGVGFISLDSYLSSDYYLHYTTYDLSGVEITSGALPVESTFGAAQALKLTSTIPIGSITITSYLSSTDTYHGSFAIDNLSFAPVPEPTAWLLTIGGFAGIGSMMRRGARPLRQRDERPA
jgi:hypothetical protein